MEENKPQQLSLNLSPEVAKGNYSNLALISHSRSEVIVDFAKNLPGYEKPEIVSRIIMTPEHAKMLMNALLDNISKYEAHFGRIDLGGKGPKGTTFNFADFGGPLGGGNPS
ncbi:MAG: DUF3467 domain-containing protein [Bacteroidales bacterium]|nr:DUF3467 domain-containing protein [Bacteroidales bacterium]